MLVRLCEQLAVCTESVDAQRHHVCQGAGAQTPRVSGWSLARPHRGLDGLVIVAFYKEKPGICLVERGMGKGDASAGPC